LSAVAPTAAPGVEPSRERGRPGAVRVYGYMLLRYKRTWRGTVTNGFLYPILYLLAIGVGLGHLVDQHLAATGTARLGGLSYAEYIAPGLLAATSMQMGYNEATYPVMTGLKWYRVFFAMIASPIPVRSVQVGHLMFVATRLAATAAMFLAILAAFGDVRSPWAIFALPAAVLTGLAFFAPMSAFSATQENDNSFSLIYRLAVIPLFLFSGTFFPLTELPGWLQVIARVTPLYHGVALCRGFALGDLGFLDGIAHASYLVALVAAGILWGRRTYTARMYQ
jgi:lipooligosaccharide transport system permease protein